MVGKEFPDASVVLLAYAGHVDPPSFASRPNVDIQVTLNAFRAGSQTVALTPDQFMNLWGTKANTLAIYDYWSIPDWSHDEPSFNFFNVQKQLSNLFGHRITGFHAESTYSGGAIGIGPAKVPMVRMLERWAHNYRSISAELAVSYVDISEAARLASSNPAVMARIDDYAGYLHSFWHSSLCYGRCPLETPGDQQWRAREP